MSGKGILYAVLLLATCAISCSEMLGYAVITGDRNTSSPSRDAGLDGGAPGGSPETDRDETRDGGPTDKDTTKEETDPDTSTDSPSTDQPDTAQESDSDTPADTEGSSDDSNSDESHPTDPDGTDTPTETETDPLPLVEIPITFDKYHWIDRSANALGIQGGWNAYADETAAISVNTAQITRSRFCVSGYVTYPDSADFENQYGAKVGFGLCATHPPGDFNITEYSISQCEWSPDLGDRLVGFAFELEGILPYPELRVQFKEQNRRDGTYVPIHEDGYHRVFFEDATLAYDPDAPPIHPEAIIEFEFFISSSMGTTPFDFCINDISALAYE